jgi:hypothetical protein
MRPRGCNDGDAGRIHLTGYLTSGVEVVISLEAVCICVYLCDTTKKTKSLQQTPYCGCHQCSSASKSTLWHCLSTAEAKLWELWESNPRALLHIDLYFAAVD